MTLTRCWLRLELRRSWRSLAVLVLLVTFVTGAVLTGATGARRGWTAIDRLTATTLPATVQVVGYGQKIDWTAVRALPEVAAAGTFADSMTFRVAEVPEPFVAGNPPADDQLMRTVERPVVLAGRLYDPNRPDEVVVSAGFVTRYGLGVGDQLTAVFYDTKQLAQLQGANPALITAAGPRERLRIVGVVRSMWFTDQVGYVGTVAASPALIAKHPANVGIADGALGGLVRLRNGDADRARFQADLAKITGRPDLTVRSLDEFTTQWKHSTSFEAAWLAAIAAAAAIAGAWTVGQVVARQAGNSVTRLAGLRAVGMTRAQAVLLAAAAPVLAGTLGVVLGVLAAVAGSRWFPIGLARYYEPDPGIHLDLLVLGPGLLAGVLLVAGTAALSGHVALRASARPGPARRSTVALAASRLGLPVPVSTGARFALESGQGRTRVPARPALVGAVVGVTGVLAAFTLAAGVHDAAHNPARFGQNWDLWVLLGLDGNDIRPSGQALAVAGHDRDVAGINDMKVGIGQVGDALANTVFGYDPASPALVPVMLSGRPPTGPDEIVLAPETARAAGASVGGTVEVSGNTTAGATVAKIPLTVAGIGFVPTWSDSSYFKGAWVSQPAFGQLFTGFDFRLGQVALRPGSDADAAVARITTALGPLGKDGPGGTAVQRTDPLTPLDDIARVSRLPSLLGGFLALLALAAAAHALFTTFRRRAHELAVHRALGMTRRQVRGVLGVQAGLLALAGLGLGIPLGVALGRTVWLLIAHDFPLQYAAPTAATALLLALPVTALVAMLLAAWPAHRAAGLRVAEILRTE